MGSRQKTDFIVTSEETWSWKGDAQIASRLQSDQGEKLLRVKTHPADCAVFKDDPHRIGDYNYVTRGSANDLHVFELMGCEGHLPAPVSGLQAQQALTQLAARSAVCANK